MTPRRVVWVVEEDGLPIGGENTRRKANAELDWLSRVAARSGKKRTFRVVRYIPACPRRKGGGVVDR